MVAIEGAVAWLQPEQRSGCGACAAASLCGAATLARAAGGGRAGRLAARCVPVAADRLAVGDRIVVGLRDDALARAALTAYALPLAVMLGAALLADMAGGGDHIIALAMAGGLAAGLALARWAGVRAAEGPRVLRHASALAGDTGGQRNAA
ncbi:SoxR reducing system RseC family protein [Aromatoleum evansii]|uniref:SoxR reducing system RseC family protein n=2 Tax=Aromatoleum evansii TaxID=59406 RepID=A0ABZ1AGR1_AROEV|nr:SoxR reducing system RseC family protein [Aromatoleum evansii]